MTQHVSFIIRLILVLNLLRKMAWGLCLYQFHYFFKYLPSEVPKTRVGKKAPSEKEITKFMKRTVTE